MTTFNVLQLTPQCENYSKNSMINGIFGINGTLKISKEDVVFWLSDKECFRATMKNLDLH